MNPEQQPKLTDLQSKLSSILDWVEQTAKSAEQFAVEQTPLYIQELLAWNFWYSLVWFIIGVIYLIIGLSSAIYLYKKRNTIIELKEDYPPPHLLSIISLVLGFICGSITTMGNLEWFQIWVAPRVWLVEYVASKL